MVPRSSGRHGNEQRLDWGRGSLSRRNGGKGMDLSVRGLAARQLADYRSRTPGTFFGEEDQPHLNLDAAYAVQSEVVSLSRNGESRWPDTRWALPAWARASSSAWMARYASSCTARSFIRPGQSSPTPRTPTSP